LETPDHIRESALLTLSAIAEERHRASIKIDLSEGRMTSNELVAAALLVVNFKSFTPAEFTKVLEATKPESDFGLGPVSRALKHDLIRKTDFPTALVILTGVLNAMPLPEPAHPFVRLPESEQPIRAWLIDILPAAFTGVVSLLDPQTDSFSPEVILAGLRIEVLSHSQYSDRNDLRTLNHLIAGRPAVTSRTI
jgi:hypothetical protein